MNTRSVSAFKYGFRAPHSQVEGPIRFAVGQTVPGRLIIGRSQRGICAIFLGDDVQALLDQRAATFPAFEQQVWHALCGIPSDKTRSYGDVARDLGVPDAVRAVAFAQ